MSVTALIAIVEDAYTDFKGSILRGADLRDNIEEIKMILDARQRMEQVAKNDEDRLKIVACINKITDDPELKKILKMKAFW